MYVGCWKHAPIRTTHPTHPECAVATWNLHGWNYVAVTQLFSKTIVQTMVVQFTVHSLMH